MVAAPQNETSIAQAGIAFDGHPSFVARQTGTDEAGVYMMLCFGDTRIAHCTLHRSVREAIALVTKDNVARTIRAADAALKRLGIAQREDRRERTQSACRRRRAVRPEEIEIIKPAMDQAAADGIAVAGPFGADTMFHMPGFDAFVVMLHDQGHIATKLMAQNAAAALTIGTPILFASVAHGTGHDIAGKGIANPAAMIEAVLMVAKAKRDGLAPAAVALLFGKPDRQPSSPAAAATWSNQSKPISLTMRFDITISRQSSWSPATCWWLVNGGM